MCERSSYAIDVPTHHSHHPSLHDLFHHLHLGARPLTIPSLVVRGQKAEEGLRLPRLPTPRDGAVDGVTPRDVPRDQLRGGGSNSIHAQALMPLKQQQQQQQQQWSARGDSDQENRDTQASGRLSSPEDESRPDGEGRRIQINSRTDGRAWEDSPSEVDKDPVSQAFREARMQVQVVKKKEGSKEFPSEVKGLESKIKRLEAQVMILCIRRGAHASIF